MTEPAPPGLEPRVAVGPGRALDPVAVALAVIGIPMLIAAVVLSQVRWYPVLDLAMTELRVRDVGTRHTPLIGLPGRIGDFPEQGSHPGPLSFYALALPYRVFGSSAWALQVATLVVQLSFVAVALWIGARRAGRAGVIVVAAVVAVALRGYGIDLFTQPWNPYLPLLAWIVVLLCTWSVLCGDHRMLIPLVVAGSFSAQTHVPYLLMCITMAVVAAGGAVATARRSTGADRRAVGQSALIALAVGFVLWVPALIDQVRRDPGNISMLVEHFTGPSDDPIGLRAGFELTLRHLDLVGGFARMAITPGSFVEEGFDPGGRIWPGAVLLTAWIGAVAVAIRLRHHALMRLHLVVGIALALGLVSMSRIFGKIWYYLTLWAWGTSLVLVAATIWTAVAWVRRRSSRDAAERFARGAVGVAAAIAGLATVATAVEAVRAEPAEQHLSDTLGDVLAPTMDALAAGTGPASGTDGIYRVTWDDAYFFGSQGYGLVNELERAGYRAGVDHPWRVPVTAHRVLAPGEVTAGVHLATGYHVERWRQRTDAVEVAFVEPRDEAGLAEYAALRELTIAELERDGLADLIGLVDTNLFLVSNDERASAPAQRAMARMLVLGQETAVFIIEPDAPR